jgi:glycosyltransferase involved in cell wall biosynthesis
VARLDRENRYVLYFSDAGIRGRTITEAGIAEAPNVTAEILPYGLFSPWNQVFLPARLRRARIDVFHSTNYMIPLLAFPRRRAGRVRCVVTIHDVIPLLFPQAAPRSRKSRLFPLYRRLMLEIDMIIADSETSRADVIRLLQILPDRRQHVRTIYCGVADQFRNAAVATPPAPSQVRTVLYVGRSDPYKNLVGLVVAFAAARKESAMPMRLTIVGPRDPRYPEAETRAAQLGIAEAVTWTGYLDDARLIEAYRQAAVLVLPSRYEGFGLPVLEAMAAGTPVICSDIPTHREIAGTAALFVDPDETTVLSQAIIKVLTDPRIAAELRTKGLARSGPFTWSRTAAQTLAVYQDVMKMPNTVTP